MESSCYCRGMTCHLLRTCHTLKHFVELYKGSIKRNKKNVETNFVIECNPSDTQFNEITHLDVVDFFIKLKENITCLIDSNNV